jgi:hypothetical protein
MIQHAVFTSLSPTHPFIGELVRWATDMRFDPAAVPVYAPDAPLP